MNVPLAPLPHCATPDELTETSVVEALWKQAPQVAVAGETGDG